jgi:hypothetical protein
VREEEKSFLTIQIKLIVQIKKGNMYNYHTWSDQIFVLF